MSVKDELLDINPVLKKKINNSISKMLEAIELVWMSKYFEKEKFNKFKDALSSEIYNQMTLISYDEKTYEEIFNDVEKIFYKIYDEFKFNVIIGIPRGGVIISTLISYFCHSLDIETVLLNIPSYYPIKYDDKGYPILYLNELEIELINNKNILLIDDGIFTGKTINKYIELLKPYCHKIKTFTLNYNNVFSELKPDYSLYETQKLIKYPWKSNADPYLLFVTKKILPFCEKEEFNIKIKFKEKYILINSKMLKKILKQYNMSYVILNNMHYLIYDDNYSYEMKYENYIMNIEINRMNTLYETDDIIRKYRNDKFIDYQIEEMCDSIMPIMHELKLYELIKKIEIYRNNYLVKSAK